MSTISHFCSSDASLAFTRASGAKPNRSNKSLNAAATTSGGGTDSCRPCETDKTPMFTLPPRSATCWSGWAWRLRRV
ncbi:MAG: hypothetical protein EOO65_02360 [Methanosarcinales archaeon]|nr:MAG: hypothetical protein EOO65_02360 [Methanosarcinales archaeon]